MTVLRANPFQELTPDQWVQRPKSTALRDLYIAVQYPPKKDSK